MSVAFFLNQPRGWLSSSTWSFFNLGICLYYMRHGWYQGIRQTGILANTPSVSVSVTVQILCIFNEAKASIEACNVKLEQLAY
jgi:hypothetical protein